jgi:hypothetical protein
MDNAAGKRERAGDRVFRDFLDAIGADDADGEDELCRGLGIDVVVADAVADDAPELAAGDARRRSASLVGVPRRMPVPLPERIVGGELRRDQPPVGRGPSPRAPSFQLWPTARTTGPFSLANLRVSEPAAAAVDVKRVAGDEIRRFAGKKQAPPTRSRGLKAAACG